MISFKKIWNHFPFVIYVFVWFGIFVGGIFAPGEAVQVLKSNIITEGYHISLYSCIIMFPFMVFYLLRIFRFWVHK